MIRGELGTLEEKYPGATLFNVLGADTILRCKNRPKLPTVVIPRPGHELGETIGDLRKSQPKVYVGNPSKQLNISLTELRKAIRERRQGDVEAMCGKELSLWLSLYYGSKGPVKGDDNTFAYATVHESRYDFCDICNSQVDSLAFECKACDYG